MPRRLPPGCVEDTDRHGNVRVYYRPTKKCKKVRLSGTPWTESFMAEYDAAKGNAAPKEKAGITLEHFSIRLGVARVCEISFAFVFGNLFEKRGDCSPKFLNSSRLHFA